MNECCVDSFFFKCLFLRERERETEREQAGEGQREGNRGSEAGSALTAASLMWDLNSQTAK